MEKNILKRVASLALAVVMMLSVLVVVDPQEVSAANSKTFKNASGTKKVKISDEEAYGTPNPSYAGVPGTQQYYWIKFSPKKDGYVTVKAANASTVFNYTQGAWRLYNSNKKKALSPEMTFSTYSGDSYDCTDYYGVKKGTTYNLRVQAYMGANISLKFATVSEKSGSKQSKAKSLQKGKEITGILTAGKKESDWYKVNLSSDAYLRLDMKFFIEDRIQVQVKGPGIRTATDVFTYKDNNTKQPYRFGTGSGAYFRERKVRKGTYYIQIKQLTNTSTGAYKLKWK